VNRLSRILVLLSLIAAIALEVHLAAREYGPLLRYVEVAFVVGLLTASRFPLPPISLGAGLTYAAPVLLSVAIGRYRLPYLLIWISFMAGGIAGSQPLRGWGLPSPWRWPLVTWALIIAAAWPVIVWRETDFDFGTLTNYRLLNTSAGIPPPVAVLGILDAAITHLLGLLWFDWLHTHIGSGSIGRFNRVVAIPLGLSAFLACLLGAYQGTIDLEFWTSGNWHVLKRAAGSMLDGNVSGMVAACWAPAFIALGLQLNVPYRRLAAGAGSGLALVAVWASGSRTALLAALFGVMWVAAVIVRRLEGPTKRWAIAAAAGCVVVAIVMASALPLRTIGPIERLRAGLGATSANGLRAVVTSLWTRDGYGSASTQAIREAPLVGVGVGAFTMLSLDYAVIATNAPVDYDNAQNWFRHQLAELGLLGSVGWIVWVAAFAMVLMRRTPSGPTEIPAAAIKGAILGLTAASLLGVPTQSTAMTLTFWTFAFWYLVLVAPAHDGATMRPVFRNRERLGWALAVVLTAAHFAGTLHAAHTEFSVPQRADRRGWNYEHGFYEPRSVDGRTFRYTHRRSAAVIGKTGRIFRLRVWTDDPSAASDPVAAKVWIDGRVILDTRLTYGTPVALRMPMLVDQDKMLIRTWVERTWRQEANGAAPRDVGLAVDWTFDN
jgi:hypothetical protein